MANVSIDMSDVKDLQNYLKVFNRRAMPFANRSALNTAAFTAQKAARGDIETKFITRNKFTQQSIRVDRARGTRISQQRSIVGSIAPYMEVQEFGGTKVKKGKRGVNLPTAYAAGQAMGSRPRLKLPRGKNKLSKIHLRRGARVGKTRKQKNMIAVRMAAKSGQKYTFLDLGARKGIFRIIGGSRNPTPRMVHAQNEQSVTIKRKPWLKPVVDRVRKAMPLIYFQALQFQVRRQRIFMSR